MATVIRGGSGHDLRAALDAVLAGTPVPRNLRLAVPTGARWYDHPVFAHVSTVRLGFGSRVEGGATWRMHWVRA